MRELCGSFETDPVPAQPKTRHAYVNRASAGSQRPARVNVTCVTPLGEVADSIR